MTRRVLVFVADELVGVLVSKALIERAQLSVTLNAWAGAASLEPRPDDRAHWKRNQRMHNYKGKR